LERCFADELECGSVEMDAVACGMLAKRIREGNLTAIIWYQKNRMGWKDVVEQQRHGGEIDLSIQINPAELAGELERRNLPGMVFGIDTPQLDPPRIEATDESLDAASDPLPDISEPETDDDERRAKEFQAQRLMAHIGRYGRSH
jgi:hypothetical protein